MPSSRNFFEVITAASPCACELMGEQMRVRAHVTDRFTHLARSRAPSVRALLCAGAWTFLSAGAAADSAGASRQQVSRSKASHVLVHKSLCVSTYSTLSKN
jgi:hypothetical protein